jgi:hypothetical protein
LGEVARLPAIPPNPTGTTADPSGPLFSCANTVAADAAKIVRERKKKKEKKKKRKKKKEKGKNAPIEPK